MRHEVLFTWLDKARYHRFKHISTPTTVTRSATVRDIPIGRSGAPGDYAHLTFDRNDQNGRLVHCDVPQVHGGEIAHRLSPGDLIAIAPRVSSCWDPDII